MTADIPAAAQADPADLKPVRLSGRAPRLLVVDNYDSFTYNLVQYLGQLGSELTVLRNDAFTPADIATLNPDGIVISPGPCTPREAGGTLDLIRELAGTIPMLGVCLGHQAIGAAYGARVERARVLMHGKTSSITHDGQDLFRGLDNPLTVTRYHSLVLRGLPPELQVTASVSEAGEDVIMGLRHTHLPLWGVQFHPESILSQGGHRLLRNFLEQLEETR